MNRLNHASSAVVTSRRAASCRPLTPATLLAAGVLIAACNNSGSVDVNVIVPTTRTPTATAGAVPTDTPVPGESVVPTETMTPGAQAPTPTEPEVGETVTPASTALETPTVNMRGVDTATPTAPGQSSTPTAVASETFTPTPTPTPMIDAGPPDLVPRSVGVIAPTPVGGCITDIDQFMPFVEVCVLNQGSGPAGPFDVALEVVSALTVSFSGADAGAEVCESAPLATGQLIFVVDSGDAVAESDETNNEISVNVERPALPPICPTPAS